MIRCRAWRGALLLGIAQACASGPAWGSLDPPRYDSNHFCRMRADTPDGFSDEAQVRCLASQRLALERIRQEWHEIPDVIRTSCDELTRLRDPFNYVALRSCIDTQLRRIPPAPEGGGAGGDDSGLP